MAEGLLLRRSGSRALGGVRLVRRGSRVLGGVGLVSAGSGGVVPPAVPAGGEVLLTGEANGFAVDFLHPVDAERVAVKAANVVTEYAVDAFFANAGTSPKQVTDVAGTLVWSPHNMALRSSEFDNASWGKTNSTVTANAIAAPDGTLTADAFIPGVAASVQYLQQNVTTIAAAAYTFSVYAKNGTLGSDWIDLTISSTTTWRVWFNLATGAKGTSLASPTSYNITSVGSGWYRLDVTVTAGTTTTSCFMLARPSDGSTSFVTGDAITPAFYAWGAQLVRGSTPGTYLPTTTAARYGLALDYDPVTHAAKGLLCEPAATNLVLESNAFNATWGLVTTTITANATVAPNGVTEADTATFAAGATSQVYTAVTVTATTYTLSVFARTASGTKQFRLRINDGTTVFLSSDLVATTDWQRFSFTQAVAAGTGNISVINGSAGAAGDLILWGAQLETGTVATSPIPTFAASATRAGDQYNVTPTQINHSATAGSWWAEHYLIAGVNGRIIGYTTSASAPIYYNASINTIGISDGTALFKTVVAGLTGFVHKTISAWQSSDRATTTDGLAVATDTTMPVVLFNPGAGIFFGSNAAGGSPMTGYIRRAYYVPRRMTNTELVTKTT